MILMVLASIAKVAILIPMMVFVWRTAEHLHDSLVPKVGFTRATILTMVLVWLPALTGGILLDAVFAPVFM